MRLRCFQLAHHQLHFAQRVTTSLPARRGRAVASTNRLLVYGDFPLQAQISTAADVPLTDVDPMVVGLCESFAFRSENELLSGGFRRAPRHGSGRILNYHAAAFCA
jgi:hypothetical protein